MANRIHLEQKSKVRRRKQKAEPESLEIKSARYIQNFSIALTFSNDKIKLVDFLPLFHKYVKVDQLKYFAPQNFKKFIVKNGNIYWGKNEDVIFPASLLLNNDENTVDETLYVI